MLGPRHDEDYPSCRQLNAVRPPENHFLSRNTCFGLLECIALFYWNCRSRPERAIAVSVSRTEHSDRYRLR